MMRLNKEVVPTGFSLNRTKYQGSFIVMHGSVPTAISGGVDIFEVSECHLLQQISYQ